MDKDQLQEPNSICSTVLLKGAVVVNGSDKDATKDRDTSATVLPKDSYLPKDKDATKGRDTSATVLPKDSYLPKDKDATKGRDTSATVLPKDSYLPEDKDATEGRDTSAIVLPKDPCLPEDKDATKDRDTSATVLPKDSYLPKDKDATKGRDTSATVLPKDSYLPKDKDATKGRDTSATVLPKDSYLPEDKDATEGRDTSAIVLPKDPCLPEDKDATKDRDSSAIVLPKDSYLPEDKDATEGRDTSATVLPKDSCSKHASKLLVSSKSKQKPYRELPPAYILPYLVLIKNCLDLPFPTIKKQCLTGEILCKIDSLTLRRKKKKSPTSLELAKVPTLQETKYVTFEGLEDLQWKLFKGLLKRKPKTVGIWRKAHYTKKPVTTVIREAKEHILPLLPKDWIIDESLKFSKEKIFSFFLEPESPVNM